MAMHKGSMLLLAVADMLAAAGVAARSWGPRDLEELKQEAQRRAERRLPPVGNVNPEDMREALADLYLLMKSGDPKDVWVNPDGGHMGRSEKWPQGRIVERVVMPWIERALSAPPAKP